MFSYSIVLHWSFDLKSFKKSCKICKYIHMAIIHSLHIYIWSSFRICWFTHHTLLQSGDKCGVLSNEPDAYKQRKCLLWLWCWWWDLYLKLFFKVKLKFLSKLLLIPKIYLLILLLPSVECRNYKLFVEFMLGKRVYYNILWGLYNITVLSL